MAETFPSNASTYSLSSPNLPLQTPNHTLQSPPQALYCAFSHTLYTPDQFLVAPSYPLMSHDHHLEDYWHPLRTPTNPPKTLTYPCRPQLTIWRPLSHCLQKNPLQIMIWSRKIHKSKCLACEHIKFNFRVCKQPSKWASIQYFIIFCLFYVCIQVLKESEHKIIEKNQNNILSNMKNKK